MASGTMAWPMAPSSSRAAVACPSFLASVMLPFSIESERRQMKIPPAVRNDEIEMPKKLRMNCPMRSAITRTNTTVPAQTVPTLKRTVEESPDVVATNTGKAPSGFTIANRFTKQRIKRVMSSIAISRPGLFRHCRRPTFRLMMSPHP